VSGGAPLAPEIQRFLRIAFGCAVVQGYGMTETAGVIAVQPQRDGAVAVVGPPAPGTRVKIVPVPAMGHPEDGSLGELLVRGPQVGQACLAPSRCFYFVPVNSAPLRLPRASVC
jgi:long-chain acyl-CoA synthetase